jgi:hypothetical protein
LFSKDEAAIAWARKMAQCYASGPVDETLTDTMKAAGWLYYGCYSSEGDRITVVARSLDNPALTH